VPPPFPPTIPPPTGVTFPDPRRAGRAEVLAVGSDFRPGTLLEAYARGIFPWPDASGTVPWCSMLRRAVFPLEEPPHWSRSLRRALRVSTLARTLDEAFGGVIDACGDERPDARWIIPPYVEGYRRLHALGWAHSVEIWEKTDEKTDEETDEKTDEETDEETDEGTAEETAGETAEGRLLVGGIYGIAMGGFFAGESMFHRRTDASKIAFATLVHSLRSSGFELFDVQVMNPHLRSLGCVEIPRREYLERLARAVSRPACQLALALP
jgi:leucyl/phenylalanyl-tRNA--protein transferase